MLHVQWSQIEAECGDFREGFVAIFRKYEGFPTDENDERGRTVKVTQASFARHVGVPENTFRDWVKTTMSGGQVHDPEARRRAQRSEVRAAVRNDPGMVVEAVTEAPVETQDQIFETLRERRAVELERVHGPAPNPEEAGERIRRRMNRAFGDETDQATDYLNGAASDITNAVMAKERWGIRHPEPYAQARDRITHWLAVLDADGAEVSAEDRAFLDQIGAEL